MATSKKTKQDRIAEIVKDIREIYSFHISEYDLLCPTCEERLVKVVRKAISYGERHGQNDRVRLYPYG